MTEDATPQRTILVVEDDTDIRASLCDLLESEGYKAVPAANGREALRQLESMAPPCVILLDLMMPVMNGTEFLAMLRADHLLGGLPVVVVSAWPREAAKIREQIQGFVSKPVALQTLLDAVGRHCSVLLPPEGGPSTCR